MFAAISRAFHHFMILAESLRSYENNLWLGLLSLPLMLECCAAHGCPYLTFLLLFDFSVAINKSWVKTNATPARRFDSLNHLIICWSTFAVCAGNFEHGALYHLFILLKMCLFVSSLDNSEHDVCPVFVVLRSFYLLWVTSIWTTLSLQFCVLWVLHMILLQYASSWLAHF